VCKFLNPQHCNTLCIRDCLFLKNLALSNDETYEVSDIFSYRSSDRLQRRNAKSIQSIRPRTFGASVVSCPAISCPAFSCPVIWSVIFTSCNFMPGTLVLQFHVLLFHALQIGPSISRPSFSRPAFSAPPCHGQWSRLSSLGRVWYVLKLYALNRIGRWIKTST